MKPTLDVNPGGLGVALAYRGKKISRREVELWFSDGSYRRLCFLVENDREKLAR